MSIASHHLSARLSRFPGKIPGVKKHRKPDSKKSIVTPEASASQKSFGPLLVILLISFVAFLPVLGNGFVNWDDDRYITGNRSITSLNIAEVFSHYFERNYHPITLIV